MSFLNKTINKWFKTGRQERLTKEKIQAYNDLVGELGDKKNDLGLPTEPDKGKVDRLGLLLKEYDLHNKKATKAMAYSNATKQALVSLAGVAAVAGLPSLMGLAGGGLGGSVATKLGTHPLGAALAGSAGSFLSPQKRKTPKETLAEYKESGRSKGAEKQKATLEGLEDDDNKEDTPLRKTLGELNPHSSTYLQKLNMPNYLLQAIKKLRNKRPT
ncbi:MAG: hypothetical protein GY858_01140 [Candidatus Omnitrophica bacterium]|nr:hypothetical protein [Candidatus Omnitrophota bacterium]